MEKLLEISDLKVEFRSGETIVLAADGVNLMIERNQTVVLAGESGSGKSVTALAITQNLASSAKILSGKIDFCGRDLLNLDKLSLTGIRGRDIAYIFQEPSAYLNPVFNIASQITEAIILHQGKNSSDAHNEAMRLLELVNIQDPAHVMNCYPHQLSGGMNQRVFIAMALACRPKLLIADEPTTSLDVTIQSQILHLLIGLKESLGFTLLFITHNLSIARSIADKIYIMYQGKIVEEGSPEKIFTSSKHFHTQELIDAYNKIGTL